MERWINDFQTLEDLKEGCILLMDKPLEWTSFDVVNKVRGTIRRKFQVKKIKVGHAGTLDPLASGLLVICIGKMTKQIQYLTADDKTYTGTIMLGATTPSYDLETEVDAEFPTDHIDAEAIAKASKNFLGEQLQTPPVFSAKKIDGKRAYQSAREGKEVKMRQAQVTIHRFETESDQLPAVRFEVVCSKGTYIRSLAYDFGKALDSGGHLTTLRRTKSGEFDVKDAWSLEQFQVHIDGLPSPAE